MLTTETHAHCNCVEHGVQILYTGNYLASNADDIYTSGDMDTTVHTDHSEN